MSTDFSAKEPALGYLYQIRYGLMLILAQKSEDSRLYIEGIDDISIETDDFLSVFQTKLHIRSPANLSDASPDLWKTIRIWSEKIKSGEIIPEISILNLITTANVGSGSICADLRVDTIDSRDTEEIRTALIDVTETSFNEENKTAYEAFLRLSKGEQTALIDCIAIVDSSIDIIEAKDQIFQSLKFSAVKIDPLFERLEGWFLGQVIRQLLGERKEILQKEVREKILEIADCLKADNLPNDFNTPVTDDDTQLAPYKDQVFVRQLEAIDANQRIINYAISDYHRAYSQKSKWLREGLIDALDEIEYHKKLKEDWERKFAILSGSPLSDDPSEQKLKGMAFYVSHYVDRYPEIHIKTRFREQYMVTGCCHDMANDKKIGWHPDFDQII